jgi:hypothetical protein
MIEAIDFEFQLAVFGFSIVECNRTELIVVAAGWRGDIALAELKADGNIGGVDG